MSQPAIKVEGLWKEYTVGAAQQRHGTFYDLLVHSIKAPFNRLRNLGGNTPEAEQFWALRDINFEIQPGEVVGVIGRNGAGKSTLLKILSRITAPTRGRIEVRGRLASLLEVGTGFHAELSGRENIYLNGSILGMTRAEVAHKFDEIVDFAEIGKFIDTPVKRYSSGMYVRLAFAVAAHLETDVLLIDEVLAVGDAEFQRRCIGKIEKISRQENRTVIFVSHNLDAIQRLCSTGIYLRNGGFVKSGKIEEVISEYGRGRADIGIDDNLLSDSERIGSGLVRVRQFLAYEEPKMVVANVLKSGCDYFFEISCQSFLGNLNEKKCVATIEFADAKGVTVLFLSSPSEGVVFELNGEISVIGCRVKNLALAPGEYALTIYIGSDKGDPLDLLKDALRVTIVSGDFYGTGHPGFPDFCRTLTRAQWSMR